MTHNTDTKSSAVPNGHPNETPALRIITETPESLPVVPPLPDPASPPQHPNPPRPNPWDLLWFW